MGRLYSIRFRTCIIALLLLSVSAPALAIQYRPFSVWRKDYDCTVRMHLQIAIEGASDAEFQKIKGDLEESLQQECDINCPFASDYGPCKIEVTVDVRKRTDLEPGEEFYYYRVEVGDYGEGEPSSVAALGEANRPLEEMPTYPSPCGIHHGHWQRDDVMDDTRNVACHEALHLMGLGDRYCRVCNLMENEIDPKCMIPGPVPIPIDECDCDLIEPLEYLECCSAPCDGYEDDIMGRSLNPVRCRNIVEVADSAGENYCPENCCELRLMVRTPTLVEAIAGRIVTTKAELMVLEYEYLGIGGFDFLIGYDPGGLTPMQVLPGELPENCGWEYFVYRYGWQGNCEGPCPSGLLRIVAIADLNNGPIHPSCYGPQDSEFHELAEIDFYVTNDRTYDCMFLPIRFFWQDCGDNALSTISGDTLLISDRVFDYDGDEVTGDVHYGGHWWLGDCQNPDTTKPSAIPLVGFVNGGIQIICADSIDAPGDLNLNEIPCEIADAVLFTNYFIYGLSVFDINLEGQIAATDVNNDGRVLTVADLVYLVRIITGDELAYPKLSQFANSVEISWGEVVSSRSPVDIGAALFVYDGVVDVQLLADGMTLKSDVADNQTNVLVWSDGRDRIAAGNTDILEVTGNAALVETEVSDYYGNLMTVKMAEKTLPSSFALRQNYPNPFNPQTQISFDLPEGCHVRLVVYNIMGQQVAVIEDSFMDRGSHTVTWDGMTSDGTSAPSGVYLYRLTAGEQVETRKMMLLR